MPRRLRRATADVPAFFFAVVLFVFLSDLLGAVFDFALEDFFEEDGCFAA
jgi:hypothetical protein